MRGPDFRFGARETRAEQAWGEHPFHKKANGSWRGAGGFRTAPCRDVPAETERRRTWGSNGCVHLSWDPINWLYELSALRRARRANWIPRRELIEPIGSHERPSSKARVALSAPLKRLLEPGELRLIEREEEDHANVTVTST